MELLAPQDQAGWEPSGAHLEPLAPLTGGAPVCWPQPGPWDEAIALHYKFVLSSLGHAHRTMLLGVENILNSNSPGRTLVQFEGGPWHGGWHQDEETGELEILWEEHAFLRQCTPVTCEPQVYRRIPCTTSFSRESAGKLEVLTLWE